MQRRRNHTYIALPAALALMLAGSHIVIAQQSPQVAVNIDAEKALKKDEEVAYQTLVTFVPWLLARSESMKALGDGERCAIFKAFAQQHMWKKGIPEGDGGEG